MCARLFCPQADAGAQHNQHPSNSPHHVPAATSGTKVHWFPLPCDCSSEELCPDSGLPHSRTGNLQESHKQGHRSTNTICSHGTTGPSEPQKAHTLLEGPTCRIPSPRHLLGMTHLSHISQRFRYTQMGGVEAPTKPLKDSCRSYS